jgi:hypothetical protein
MGDTGVLCEVCVCSSNYALHRHTVHTTVSLFFLQPNFMVSFLNNTVTVGNAWGGQTGGMATTSCIGAADCGSLYAGPMNRAILFRGNTLLNNAAFSIGGLTAAVVVENNKVANNNVGFTVANTTTAVFLRGNQFVNVSSQFVGMPSHLPSRHCNTTDPATGVSTHMTC